MMADTKRIGEVETAEEALLQVLDLVTGHPDSRIREAFCGLHEPYRRFLPNPSGQVECDSCEQGTVYKTFPGDYGPYPADCDRCGGTGFGVESADG